MATLNDLIVLIEQKFELLKLPHYPDKPVNINRKINIGAGKTPLEGYYNIDYNTTSSIVHKGDAFHLPEVKTGSQTKINIDNPYGYNPLNPEIMRILSKDGEIRLVGNLKNNKYFRNAIKSGNLEELNLNIILHREISSGNYKLSNGEVMKETKLTEIILRRE